MLPEDHIVKKRYDEDLLRGPFHPVARASSGVMFRVRAQNVGIV